MALQPKQRQKMEYSCGIVVDEGTGSERAENVDVEARAKVKAASF